MQSHSSLNAVCHHLLIPTSKSSTHITMKYSQALAISSGQPSPPNARSTTEDTKKNFLDSVQVQSSTQVETGRSKRVESQNADAMPPPRRQVLYEVAAHSCLSHTNVHANVCMYTRNRRVDLLVDWSEKLRHVQGQVRHTVITSYITDTPQFLAPLRTI